VSNSEFRRAAVLGHPIAHSLSPALHNAGYQAVGLTHWSYDAHDVTVEQLPGFLRDLDESWAGLSITMPLKHVVAEEVDIIHPLAEVVGAVNTVLFQTSRGGRLLVGANTDVYGIVASLQEKGVSRVSSAAVLGAGGTAAAALAALGELGCSSPHVLVRSRGRAGGLLRAADRMGVHPQWRSFSGDDAFAAIREADVVISTVPAGATDAVAKRLHSDGAGISSVLLDAVYDPWPTPLASIWAQLGGKIVPGTAMLMHQAAEQFRLMTGIVAPIDAMRDALSAAGKPVS